MQMDIIPTATLTQIRQVPTDNRRAVYKAEESQTFPESVATTARSAAPLPSVWRDLTAFWPS